MFCALSYRLYNLKNVKNTYEGVLIFASFLPVTLLKVTLHYECFSCFLNCTNGTKSRNTSQLF